jgi:tripartite-type tricarboxylate transporter receptor subunit TctC
MRSACCMMVFGCALLFSAAAASQAYPEKPIRLIVPFAAGGNADILARIIGQKLGETLGQQVIVDNRGGANGVIGTDLAAKAAPDGHTLLFIASGHAINPGLYAKLPFDPVRDFAAISLVGSTPLILAVNAALPAKTVKELIALAKRRPGELSYASQGNGSPGHLAGALLNNINKINILHVPYKSTAQAITDLTSGQVQVMYPSMTSVLPHIKAGKLRGLAITSRRRSALAPELPTMVESGVPGYEASIWNGMLAPAATPKAIITKLNAAVVRIIAIPEVKQRIAGLGADPMTSTPEEFGAFIAAEIKKWGKVIKDAGVRID